MKQTILFILIAILIILFLFWFLKGKSKKDHKGKGDTKNDFLNLNKKGDYNLNSASETYILPNKLAEISGLSYYNENELYCVNDERGKIFVYNLNDKEITNTIEFGNDGDYEGIEVVGNTVFVMSSVGKIKAINLATEETKTINCTRPEVAEYEGLAYDMQRNSLLLAAKEMRGDKKVYEYNLSNKSLDSKYSIPSEFIEANNDGNEFKPSGIAVHPVSNEIYILASAGKKLLVIDKNNNKICQYNLDKELFKQPEGICFSPDGNLFISSEGKGGNGYILMFKPN